MFKKTVKPFLLLTLTLASTFFSTVFLNVPSVFASSAYDTNYRITDDINLSNPTCSINSHITTLDGVIAIIPQQYQTEFQIALSQNTAVISNQFNSSNGNGSLHIFYTVDEVYNASYNFISNGGVQINTTIGTFRYLFLTYYNSDCQFHYQTWLDSYMTISNNFNGTSNDLYNFIGGSFIANYPEFYEGLLIRQSLLPPIQTLYPEFSYIVTEQSELYLTYMQNIDNLCGQQNTWNILLENIDTEGNTISTLDESTIEQNDVYNKTLSADSYYRVTITYLNPVPCATRDDIGPVIIKLDSTLNTFQSGLTSDDSCIDGFCVPETQSCSFGGILTKINCNFIKSSQIGLLNPIIYTIRNFFSSLIVPTNPQCSLTLPDATIDGHTLSLTGIITRSCAVAQATHEALPYIALAVNFLFFIMLITMLFNAINHSLDFSRDNIIDVFTPDISVDSRSDIDDVWESHQKQGLTVNPDLFKRRRR